MFLQDLAQPGPDFFHDGSELASGQLSGLPEMIDHPVCLKKKMREKEGGGCT